MSVAKKKAGVASLAIVALALLAGCGSTTTRYYTLAEGASAAAGAQRATADTAKFAIEMAPVALPERFARPQMVVRRSGGMLQMQKTADASQTEVDVLEQSRWSSSFEYELRDALGAGIAQRLSAYDATKAGRPRGMPVYRVAVQMSQFEALPGDRLDAAFGWSVRRGDGDALVTCQLQLSETLSGGVDGVAGGAQRITWRLADEIARNVQALALNQTARCPAA